MFLKIKTQMYLLVAFVCTGKNTKPGLNTRSRTFFHICGSKTDILLLCMILYNGCTGFAGGGGGVESIVSFS